MADIIRSTLKKREQEADAATSPAQPPPPAKPGPVLDFIKGYSPEERARQQAKLVEMLRNRQ